ncbi:MAG: polysaccharide deacetylase family protein [Bacillota bacterium]
MKTNVQAFNMALSIFIIFFIVMPCGYLWYMIQSYNCILVEAWNEEKTLQDQLKASQADLELAVEKNEHLRWEIFFLRHDQLKGGLFYHGDRSGNRVSITIDDGYSPEMVEQALDICLDLGVQATFFPVGLSLEAYPALWKRAVREGHELGNHTYSHRYLTALTADEIFREITQWHNAAEYALGQPYHAVFFRPPGMAGFSESSRQAEYFRSIIASHKMITVLWDIETVYTLYSRSGPQRAGGNPSPLSTASYITREARGGSIILLHFVGGDVEALPEIIRGLTAKGLQPVTLSELLFSSSL